MAGSASGGQSRELRVCISLSGRVVDDRRLKSGESLSFGSRANNTVTIREANLPETHTLFHPKGDGYELVVTAKMSGTVCIDGDSAPVDIESLKQQGLLQKSGNEFVMTLSFKHSGTIVFGDVSVIFQFVTPPPVPPKPKLPASARGTLAQQIDWNFVAILIVSFIFHFGGIGYVNTLPTPPKEISIDTIDERWAVLIVPERKRKMKPKDDQIAKSLEKKGILDVLGAIDLDSAFEAFDEGSPVYLVGKAKFGDLDVDGELDSGPIAKVIRKQMTSIQDCYNEELKRDPSLKGKVEIELTIGEDGRIEDALVVSNSMGNETVANCILRKLKGWRFPEPDDGSVTVVFPIIFSSTIRIQPD